MELYSKEELLKELKKEYSCGGECDHCPEVLDADSCSVLRCIRRIIDNTQPIEADVILQQGIRNGLEHLSVVIRPQGEWIRTGLLGNGNAQYECSNCHYGDEQAESQEVPYCWHCGAKMRKGGADAE